VARGTDGTLAKGKEQKYDAPVTVPELEELRRVIDEVDQKILALLAERVRLVLAVGDVKRERQMPAYDPERERRILDRLASLAQPPLDGTTVRRVFERLIDEARRLEQHHMSR
jgi:chorismate mutase